MKKSFSLILGLLVLFSGNLFAQNLASVDSRLLMVLHPKMGNYDYSAGRFFRSGFSPQRSKNLYKELNEAAKNADKELRPLLKKESSLIEQRADLLIERDQTINDLATKAASETYNIRGKYERVAEYEARFDEKIARIDEQINSLYQQIESVRDKAYAPVYLSKAESRERLIEVKREIKNLTKTVAQRYKIDTVVDNSFGFRPARKKNEKAYLFLQNDDFDVLSSSLFHNLTNYNPQMPPDAEKIGATMEHMLVGGAYAKLDNLRKVSQLRSYLVPVAAEYTPGSLFIIGGTDLTAYVAKEIFKNYRIPETLKKSYLQVIREFQNIESSSYREDPPRYPNEAYGGTYE